MKRVLLILLVVMLILSCKSKTEKVIERLDKALPQNLTNNEEVLGILCEDLSEIYAETDKVGKEKCLEIISTNKQKSLEEFLSVNGEKIETMKLTERDYKYLEKLYALDIEKYLLTSRIEIRDSYQSNDDTSTPDKELKFLKALNTFSVVQDNFPYKETKTEYLNSLSEIKKGSVKWQKDKLFETASKFRKEEVDKELPKLSDSETETIFKEFTYATIDYEVALVFKDPETIKRSRDNYANALKKINPVFSKFDENPFSEDAIQSMAFYKSYLEGKISEIIRMNEEAGN